MPANLVKSKNLSINKKDEVCGKEQQRDLDGNTKNSVTIEPSKPVVMDTEDLKIHASG
jgi:hypothetical protein